jgi:hypothetical protein
LRTTLGEKEMSSRVMNIKIRVKAVINSLAEQAPLIQPSIIDFFRTIASNGSFVYDEFWKPYQKTMIDIDMDGSIK